jgi:site-specific recombinase XerD
VKNHNTLATALPDPLSWPNDAALATYRAWLQGIATQKAVERYFSSNNVRKSGAVNASARGIVGAIRRQLQRIARAKHRFDLAELFAQNVKPPTTDRLKQQHLLNAIETLRLLPNPTPHITDPASYWLTPRIATALRQADIHTLADLTVRIPRRRMWWLGIHGLGRQGAKAIEHFFSCYPDLTDRARALISRDEARAVVPWELWSPPETLDGSAGLFRAPQNTCLLSANDDYAAVQAWLSLQEAQSTQRAYRKEAERLMLWAIVERSKALSSLTTEDAVAYRAFLRKPSPRERWVGPACTRSSPQWKPYVGPLSARSIAYSFSVLTALFRWLIAQRYLVVNPFAGIKVRGAVQRPILDAGKSFTAGEWALLRTVADALEWRYDWSIEASKRLRFILDFGRATGLRRDELVKITLGQIDAVSSHQRWLNVIGKGHKAGRVVLPPLAWESLIGYLQARGIPTAPQRWNPRMPLVGKIDQDPGEGVDNQTDGISSSRLREILKRFFLTVEQALDNGLSPQLRSKLQQASPHWLRHTHATHALDAGVDLRSVRDNLRHASIATTSVYLHTSQDQRTREFSKVFD